jgi:hypothetical protein
MPELAIAVSLLELKWLCNGRFDSETAARFIVGVSDLKLKKKEEPSGREVSWLAAPKGFLLVAILIFSYGFPLGVIELPNFFDLPVFILVHVVGPSTETRPQLKCVRKMTVQARQAQPGAR